MSEKNNNYGNANDLLVDRITQASEDHLELVKRVAARDLPTREKREMTLTTLQQAYMERMALSVLRPAAMDGLTLTNIAKGVATGVAAYMVSPKFRDFIDTHVHNGKAQLLEYRDRLREQQIEEKLDDFEKRMDQFTLESGDDWRQLKSYDELGEKGREMISEDDFANFLVGREKYREAARKGRQPYTAESAALTVVSLDGAIYDLQRDGDNEENIEQLMAMREQVYEMAAFDGVTPDEVNWKHRAVVSRLNESDPGFMSMYKETAHGNVHMGVSEVCEGDFSFTREYTGDAVYHDGKPYDGEAFTLRPMMSYEEHMESIRQYMLDDFSQAENISDLKSRFMVASTGYSVHEHHDEYEEFEDEMPHELHHRYSTMQSMIHAGLADGLSEEEMKQAYLTGLQFAVEGVQYENPGLVEQAEGSFDSMYMGVMELAHNPHYGFTMLKDAQRRMREANEQEFEEPYAGYDHAGVDDDRERENPQPDMAENYRRSRRNQGYNRAPQPEGAFARATGFGRDDYDPGEYFELG